MVYTYLYQYYSIAENNRVVSPHLLDYSKKDLPNLNYGADQPYGSNVESQVNVKCYYLIIISLFHSISKIWLIQV